MLSDCSYTFTCFNTSHVVVYPEQEIFVNMVDGSFQYISCCSLSSLHVARNIYWFMFQYISCCSLSSSDFSGKYMIDCFNTSHVVVYPDDKN